MSVKLTTVKLRLSDVTLAELDHIAATSLERYDVDDLSVEQRRAKLLTFLLWTEIASAHNRTVREEIKSKTKGRGLKNYPEYELTKERTVGRIAEQATWTPHQDLPFPQIPETGELCWYQTKDAYNATYYEAKFEPYVIMARRDGSWSICNAVYRKLFFGAPSGKSVNGFRRARNGAERKLRALGWQFSKSSGGATRFFENGKREGGL